jgi:hypothetical protein
LLRKYGYGREGTETNSSGSGNEAPIPKG